MLCYDVLLGCVLECEVLIPQSGIEYLCWILYVLVRVSSLDFIEFVECALHLLSHV